MREYYTHERMLAIKESQDYKDLVLVAWDILEDINDDFAPRPIAMLSGPISTGGKGSRTENLLVFSRAIQRVSAGGLIVFDQMPFEDDISRIFKSDPRQEEMCLLEEFYLPIFETRFISLMCFLPSWESSFGARWEHEQAETIGIPRIYLADSYNRD
ncbi:MAG: hypothetical protein Q7S43_02765 [bacterium]|nr:hypothetical protein [bacterium]MDO8496352.1 hypothetical protein [bacterium]